MLRVYSRSSAARRCAKRITRIATLTNSRAAQKTVTELVQLHSVNPAVAGAEKDELFKAQRWRCSRGTVNNRLRALGARVLDFAPRGEMGKKWWPSPRCFRLRTKGQHG
jgi:hypothetical protein